MKRWCALAVALLGLGAFTRCTDEGAGGGGSGATDLPDASPDAVADADPGDSSPPADGGEDASADAGCSWPPGFVPMPPNVPTGPLCDIPDTYVEDGGDPVNPPCELESDVLSDRACGDAPAVLRVATWNVEWGRNADLVLERLASDDGLADIDVLLLQEVPRHDLEGTVPNIHLAREIALQQRLNYVFGVEWDRRLVPEQGGEHGVSILSKYPIGNARLLRHTPCYDHFAEKQHFGGRATLAADLAVGSTRVRIYDAHLATRDVDGTCRALQGQEVLDNAHAVGQPATQLLGGDFNTFICTPMLELCADPLYAEPVIRLLQSDGWTDLLPGFTSWTQLGVGLLKQHLDWLFAKGLVPHSFEVRQDIVVVDHVPVLADVSLP